MLHEYRVWAPNAERMRVVAADESVEMTSAEGGWWHALAPAGDYGFQIDDDDAVRPDPRSMRQPGGVHERSRVWDASAHAWQDAGWTGKPIAGGVIYELHVGTFTPEGTLEAAAGRLDHLREIGVTHVELLPMNAFNGTHNWGYDGVAWFAVHEGYGGPDAYQRFVDAAHGAGLAVVQDVVYNHLGPSGNYLPLYGPYLSSAGRSTWGEHVNLAEPAVRRYILDNVRFWFEDMHVDALRLDAVHALHDEAETHILEEMAIETAALAAHLGRPLELIAESDLNDPKLITPREGGGYGLDGQWSDDFHHGVHVALTGETAGYYADFEPLAALGKALERGFFHDGTYSSFRGRDHGHPIDVERSMSWRLVVAAQNHDQIGNRARGDRITEVLDESQLLCAALLLYAGPFTPMLFMGEEWAASTPFQFFTSHPEPELGKATAEGRLEEFEQMGWDPAVVPDPQDPATFERSKLDWTEAEGGRHARVLEGYRQLAQLRRELEALTDPHYARNRVEVDEERRVLRLVRRAGMADAVEIVINVGREPQTVAVERAELCFATHPDVALDGELTLPPGSGALLA
ncbi:malto-oligosyltrehalose trehalohydrolase [Agrococcus sp. Marseille-Q4369]|uniref:malto-oligosyltrehalose trehalohydrolase n=1 Tax=Agrococcus sp. Marseille-Q4369 TaxID=2810513 RepID=UPI001B8B30F6|nr:malto-oligosyltrehalose trehalohydrolase [Agrococcus sp. Marseille-Q4369]QUW17750.1 malto-oligosyltrehalose trehalohydrolase [Agrococcus sp. Marseille-Q4369]